jgi:hypothetical protein
MAFITAGKVKVTRMRVPCRKARLTGELQASRLKPGKIERSAEALQNNVLLLFQVTH